MFHRLFEVSGQTVGSLGLKPLWGLSFLGLYDVLCCGIVDFEAICCFLDCLLTLVYKLNELLSFERIYGFVAPFGLLGACIFRLDASSSCSGLRFDVTQGS